MTPTIVVWHDAHADPSGGWVMPGDIDQRPYEVTSVGWLLPADGGGKPGHVTLAQSHGQIAGDPPEAWDHVLHVPCGMVVRMVVAR